MVKPLEEGIKASCPSVLEGSSPKKRNSIVAFNTSPKKITKSAVAPIKNFVDIAKKKP